MLLGRTCEIHVRDLKHLFSRVSLRVLLGLLLESATLQRFLAPLLLLCAIHGTLLCNGPLR